VDKNGIYHLPNPACTPGKLCTPDDPNFAGYRYKAHIAYCNRNVQMDEKDAIARNYKIAKSDYHKYEFDHYIPLNSGGSDDAANIWPQPLDEAHLKDKVEDEAYIGLRDGIITSQKDAVAKIRAWSPISCPAH
jgi:hypothetical protein